MNPQSGGKPANRIGVFLRCTGQDDRLKALQAVKALGLDTVQVSKLPGRYYTPEGAAEPAECFGVLRASGSTGALIIENYVARGLKTDPMDELRRARAFLEKSGW